MFSLIRQMVIALLRFSRSLETKCVPLKNEPVWLDLFILTKS